MTKKTMIGLDVETREKLKQVGKKGETYDQIIQRLLRRRGERDEE